ncbi:MAG: YihY/virulence factor BrkB family protein, partial [Chloroflexota bacterium]
ALVTALLFTIGRELIGIYLGRGSVGSSYGAAGSIVILLIWIYYSAQILFFGAEFTKVYADAYGSRVVPAPDAMPVAEAERAQEGAPRDKEARRGAKSREDAEQAPQREREAVPAGRLVEPRPQRLAERPAPGLANTRQPSPAYEGFGFAILLGSIVGMLMGTFTSRK